MSLHAEAERFAADPVSFFGDSGKAMQHLAPDHIAALQLEALKQRFHQLRGAIPVLTTMADEQGITDIRAIDDVVPLLFQHTVYKSYPVSLLDRYRFDQLTKWLDRLSALDLGKVDVSGCDSIDVWLDAIDAQTNLRLSHSSGTSGTMSFLPRSGPEYDIFFRAMRAGLLHMIDPGRDESDAGEYFHMIWPSYRSGRSAVLRATEYFVKYIAGSEERFHAANPGAMSSDLMFLAGRLRMAASRGELDRLELSPGLKARRAEFEATERSGDNPTERLLDTIVALRGQRMFLTGTWGWQYNLARAGLDRGARGLFGPGSICQLGGGAKDQVVPPDWREHLQAFTGVPRLYDVYGMSEIMSPNYICEAGFYHLQPWVILYVLDPDTGQTLPREGVHTGRAAFYDLIAHSYWGGFISGDEVTVDWSPCACGQTTTRLHSFVQRYSEKRGGDDKITCAASDDAHRHALRYLQNELA